MYESVYQSSGGGAIRPRSEDLGDAIALAPGLNGTVWINYTAGAVHLDRDSLRDLLFLRNSTTIETGDGLAILAPSGSDGIAIGIPSGAVYIVPRRALESAARGLNSSRYTPALV